MKDIKFRAWHLKEKKMYFRGYQKWLHVLLCDDDKGKEEGRGIPIKKAPYSDVILLESTGLYDKKNTEIFEGDVVEIKHEGRTFRDVVESVPDTFGSRAHPLAPLFKKHGIQTSAEKLEIEVVGNEYG